MKAEEIRPIVEYLIEVYFENNGGIEDYKEKEARFAVFEKSEFIRVSWNWDCGYNKFGKIDTGFDYFNFNYSEEKITNLEKYVWEAIDRILEVPYYDERPRQDDPTLQ